MIIVGNADKKIDHYYVVIHAIVHFICLVLVLKKCHQDNGFVPNVVNMNNHIVHIVMKLVLMKK